MGISDTIACFINDILEMEGGSAVLQRAELAQQFKCVPSQINYVITTRFSPEHGYLVESKRGGGGYIRIRRVRLDPKQLIMHTINAVGDEIDSGCVRAFLSNLLDAEAIDRKSAMLMASALNDKSLAAVPLVRRDQIRADIFKQLLVGLVCYGVE
ncbi:CtsR family transcriptional regulator [Ruminococcaceae bacterium OttesenSCG-928-L11]|nr:CtsR family transcriptional regulator [Ruminococcaceae bacterium OttesenSCG-928-L11]